VFAGIPVVRTDLRLAASTAFELDFWGRLRRGVEAVEAQTAASYLSADIARLTLASATAQAYLLLRSIDAQLVATRTALTVRTESLALIRRRAAGGLVSDLDVAQAEGARADSEAQLIELERQRGLVERQLGGLTGRPGLTIVPGDLQTLPVPPTPPVGLPSALLDRRPDLRLAEQNLVAANARIGVARAAMLPTITLTGAFGGQSRDLSDLLAGGARIWSLGFGLTLPIFDAGRLVARADQAEARHRQLLAAYQKAAESAFREVADALSGIERSERAERVIEQRLAAARTAHGLATRRYEAGYSSYLEVLDADRVRNDAEIALVRNRQARLSFSVDLMKALGGGWMEPIAARSAPAVAR
jgi:multidrug efflux system outer membrane protein